MNKNKLYTYYLTAEDKDLLNVVNHAEPPLSNVEAQQCAFAVHAHAAYYSCKGKCDGTN